MNKILLSFFIVFCASRLAAQAPAFDWARQLGNSNIFVLASTTDKHGALYMTGVFDTVADFDPGPGIDTLREAGFGDIFIVKIDSSGAFAWAKSIGSSSYDEGNAIAIDSNGDVLVAGFFNMDSVDFDPGPGTFFMSAGENAFILKLDAAGNFKWAKQIVSQSENYITAMDIDRQGNILLMGKFGGVTDFDPGPGQANINGATNEIFILKLNAQGDYQWARELTNASGTTSGISIDADNSGDIIVSGLLLGTTDMDPGASVFNLANSSGTCSFILKLDPGGDFIWANKLEGVDLRYGHKTLTDAASNIYLAGSFSGTVNFDLHAGNHSLTASGPANDNFLLKIDSNANFDWLLPLEDVRDISLRDDRLYICGDKIAQYDLAGNNIWTLDSSLSQQIVPDDFGNLFAIGDFSGTVDFDPGLSISNMTSPGSSAFIQKLNNAGALMTPGIVSSKERLLIYPNPSSGSVSLYSANGGNFKIWNSLGIMVKQLTLTAGKQVSIYLSGLASGIYVIEGLTDGKFISEKLTVQ